MFNLFYSLVIVGMAAAPEVIVDTDMTLADCTTAAIDGAYRSAAVPDMAYRCVPQWSEVKPE